MHRFGIIRQFPTERAQLRRVLILSGVYAAIVLASFYAAFEVRFDFLVPPEQQLEWSGSGVEGASRFLRGLWRLTHDHVSKGPVAAAAIEGNAARALRRKIHETIAKVTDDVSRRYKFNTAIAAVMELVNALGKAPQATPEDRAVLQEGLEACTLLLAPIVPHCTESMWAALGHKESPTVAGWPTAEAAALDRKSTRLNSSHIPLSRMPSSA